MACTRAYCASAPLDSKFVALVGQATAWRSVDGGLELRSEAGVLRFQEKEPRLADPQGPAPTLVSYDLGITSGQRHRPGGLRRTGGAGTCSGRAELVGDPVWADSVHRPSRPGGRPALLTRDARRYRSYFPELKLIAP